MNKKMLLLSLLPILWGCDYYDSYRRAKQVRTQANLQVIAAAVEEFKNINETIPELQAVIDRTAGGKDAWGRPIIHITGPARSQDDDRSASYALISTGEDGALDVERPEEYLSYSRVQFVGWEFNRDIVIVNGRSVLNAGK